MVNFSSTNAPNSLQFAMFPCGFQPEITSKILGRLGETDLCVRRPKPLLCRASQLALPKLPMRSKSHLRAAAYPMLRSLTRVYFLISNRGSVQSQTPFNSKIKNQTALQWQRNSPKISTLPHLQFGCICIQYQKIAEVRTETLWSNETWRRHLKNYL